MLINWFLLTTPDCLQTNLPFLKTISVGTLRIWYRLANSWFWSTSILITLTRSPSSAATSFKIGDCTLHGPHHNAWKSTITGFVSLIMVSKFAFILFILCMSNFHSGRMLYISDILNRYNCRQERSFWVCTGWILLVPWPRCSIVCRKCRRFCRYLHSV